MYIIGLTGGSGTGKGVVGSLFCEFGFYHIDADFDAKTATEEGSPCLSEIFDNFDEVMQPDGTLDRKKLGDIIFSDSKKLELLNKITHKYIIESIIERIESLRDRRFKGVVIDGAALLESGFHKYCDKIIAVISPRDERIQRIADRDRIAESEAEKRIEGQKSDEFYTEKADYIIVNDGNIEKLKARVKKIAENILQGE